MPAYSLISIAMAIGFRVVIFVGTLGVLQDLAERTFFGLAPNQPQALEWWPGRFHSALIPGDVLENKYG
jgi:hypothetical protein